MRDVKNKDHMVIPADLAWLDNQGRKGKIDPTIGSGMDRPNIQGVPMGRIPRHPGAATPPYRSPVNPYGVPYGPVPGEKYGPQVPHDDSAPQYGPENPFDQAAVMSEVDQAKLRLIMALRAAQAGRR